VFEGNANEGPSFVGRGGHRSHGRPFVKAGEGALGAEVNGRLMRFKRHTRLRLYTMKQL
jgi:hypothetical protein